MSAPGGFLWGCGGTLADGSSCPSETRTLNLDIIEWNDSGKDVSTCTQVDIHGIYEDSYYEINGPFRVLRGQVAEELGWCKCGDNDAIDAAMLTFLSWLKARSEFWDLHPSPPYVPFEEKTGLDPLLEDVLAYIATQREWTEHGSMIPGWLTDAGERVLVNLQRPRHA